jgi:phage-related protein
MKRKIIFYKLDNNRCPIQDLLDSLQGKVARRVVWMLKLLEDLDSIPEKYFKKLESTKYIWECRIRVASNSYRILCFFQIKQKLF